MKRTYRKICSKCDGDGLVADIDWAYTIGTFGMAALFGDNVKYTDCKPCDGKGYSIVVEEV